MIALHDLNQVPPDVFAQSLEGVFEHSPWVAERTVPLRPFDSRLALLDALRATVAGASVTDQMSLIRAHPQLGLRGRQRAALTSASAGEQRRAGLDACTADELERLEELNAAYVAKFDMPYVLAVRGHDPASIIAHAERRLGHPSARERHQALDEIGRIAGFRLADRVTSPAGAEILAMLRRLMTQDGAAGPGATEPGSRAHAAGMLREWLLAADLEVTDEAGRLTGRRRCGAEQAQTLLVGEDAGLGLVDSLVALAVAQQLRERGVTLPFDLLVLVKEPAAAVRTGPDLGDTEGGPLMEAAALERLAQDLEAIILNNARSFEQHGALTHA